MPLFFCVKCLTLFNIVLYNSIVRQKPTNLCIKGGELMKQGQMRNTGVRMSEDTWQAIKLIADKKKRKPTELIRLIIENYVELGN